MKIELSATGDFFRVYPKDDSPCAVEVAISDSGARAIAEILFAQRSSRPVIGTASFPTQAQIHKFLRERVEEEKAAVAARLDDLDLKINL